MACKPPHTISGHARFGQHRPQVSTLNPTLFVPCLLHSAHRHSAHALLNASSILHFDRVSWTKQGPEFLNSGIGILPVAQTGETDVSWISTILSRPEKRIWPYYGSPN